VPSDSPSVPSSSAPAGPAPSAAGARGDSEQRLRLLIEQSPTSIHVVDASGRTVLVNPAFERLWGIGMEQLEGYVLWDDPQLESNGLWPYVERARRGEAVHVPPYRHDASVSVGEGAARWIETTVYPVKDERGALRELVILSTDVTLQQTAAAERERLLDAERRAREEAEAANRAKRDFLAVMSHELRTPLNAMLGYAGLLDDEVAGPLTEAQRDFLHRGSEAARRLLALVDDLLAFAKVEAGRVTIQLEKVPVAALVGDVVSLVAPQAAARGITLGVERPVDAAYVALADRERATQVLLNLVANAVKFTPAGGHVTLAVSFTSIAAREEGAPAGPAVQVAVRDTGPGIAPAELERVFEPFVQLDTGPARAAGGTGLGLAIARDLARAMHGDVLATSDVGRGSTFTLVLLRA
jgi:PAS domain S-box-containing protein